MAMKETVSKEVRNHDFERFSLGIVHKWLSQFLTHRHTFYVDFCKLVCNKRNMWHLISIKIRLLESFIFGGADHKKIIQNRIFKLREIFCSFCHFSYELFTLHMPTIRRTIAILITFSFKNIFKHEIQSNSVSNVLARDHFCSL